MESPKNSKVLLRMEAHLHLLYMWVRQTKKVNLARGMRAMDNGVWGGRVLYLSGYGELEEEKGPIALQKQMAWPQKAGNEGAVSWAK